MLVVYWCSFTSNNPNVTVSFTVDSDWGSGYQGSIRITNNNPYAIYNWQMTATFKDTFTWGPDATVTYAGTQITLTPDDGSQASMAPAGACCRQQHAAVPRAWACPGRSVLHPPAQVAVLRMPGTVPHP